MSVLLLDILIILAICYAVTRFSDNKSLITENIIGDIEEYNKIINMNWKYGGK